MAQAAVLAGRYGLREQIGEGGEARVYRAIDLTCESEVAVRLPKQARPAKAATSLPEPHPGWVEVRETGEDAQFGAYQVLELLPGETLSAQVGRAPLGQVEWTKFVRESLEAVEALHRARWVHGDLHAENFILTTRARWKLLELPFLRFSPPQPRSAAFGSIHTLSPEQLQNQAADELSDIYALGCLYYFAACREWPHVGNRTQEIAISILRFDPPPLAARAGAFAGAASDGVMRMLARARADRCATVAEARRLLAVA
jgi:serine/threonine-protein kinase